MSSILIFCSLFTPAGNGHSQLISAVRIPYFSCESCFHIVQHSDPYTCCITAPYIFILIFFILCIFMFIIPSAYKMHPILLCLSCLLKTLPLSSLLYIEELFYFFNCLCSNSNGYYPIALTI